MFTTCPKCSLKLVVTAADLRVAQGYVRCGRCGNVFNALAGLSDEQQAVLASEQSAAAREVPATAHRAPPASAAREPRAAVREPASAVSEPVAAVRGPPAAAAPVAPVPPPSKTEDSVPDDALEFNPATTDVSEVFVQANDDDPTGTFESIVLRSEDIEVIGEDGETHDLEIDLEAVVAINTVRHEPDTAKQQAPIALTPTHAEPAPRDALRETAVRESAFHEPVSAASAPPAAAARQSVPRSNSAPAAPTGPPPAPPRAAQELDSIREAHAEAFAAELAPGRHEQTDAAEDESLGRSHSIVDLALRVGSIVLAVILVLQIVNHERAELAAVSWLYAPLSAVYSALGMPLAPHWNVHAYEVRQLGADASRDPGALTVRASVKNNATREQPLPLLRVTMQDRFGNRVAARDVPPSAYLPAGSASRAQLAAGQRVDAEIAFADPGPNAVGFEIDACLKLAGGRIVCANDAAPER